MTVCVSSGNVATLAILRSGARLVLDAGWRRPPTEADKRELSRLLSIGDKALSLTIEDDARRGEVARGFLADQQETERTQ